MVNFIKSKAVHYFSTVAAVCFLVFFSLNPVSCRLTEEGIIILPCDKTCPVIESFKITGEKSLHISCSEKVFLTSVNIVCKDDEAYSSGSYDVSYDNTGKNFSVTFSNETEVGKTYVFKAQVTDLSGNSVHYERNFIGFNQNPAKLIISEICTKYDKAQGISDFIEFFCIKSGNAYGLVISGAQKGAGYDYEFPSVELKAGEYVTVHSKSYSQEECVNETGEELNLSTAIRSCNEGRDLWREGEENVFTNNDVIVLKDNNTDKICDGILLSESGKSNWSKNLQKEYSKLLYENGIWKSGSEPENAFITDRATTIHRSVSRKNVNEIYNSYKEEAVELISSDASDWYLTDKKTVNKEIISGATPGFANSSVVYEP